MAAGQSQSSMHQEFLQHLYSPPQLFYGILGIVVLATAPFPAKKQKWIA
jgi:hypothetical protein